MNHAQRAARLCALALLLAAAAIPSTAHASAALQPAGDVLDYSTVSNVTPFVIGGGLVTIRCTSFDPGAVRIPSEPANRETGQLRLTLTTRPSYSGCRNSFGLPIDIRTSGTWTATFQWGTPAVMNITVPARGIAVAEVFEAEEVITCGTNPRSATIAGNWQNGFTTPTFVNSITSFSGRIPMTWTCETVWGEMTYAASRLEVVDATNPTAIVTVGP